MKLGFIKNSGDFVFAGICKSCEGKPAGPAAGFRVEFGQVVNSEGKARCFQFASYKSHAGSPSPCVVGRRNPDTERGIKHVAE
jgi:hypothetical protein